MVKNESNLLAAFTIAILLMLPIIYFTVSLQLESQSDDDALLKRLTFVGGSVQRLIKLPDHPADLAESIDDAFSSAEAIYPALGHPDGDEAALAKDYFELKACWHTVKKAAEESASDLQKQGEICWLSANKTIFDLHNVIDARRRGMLDNIFMIAIFGALLVVFLLYEIYRYVHTGLEKNQFVDLETGLFNTHAFLEECARYCSAASRSGRPFSVVLIKFHDAKARRGSLGKIVDRLKRKSRREEKLFRLSTFAFALMTVDTPKSGLAPLVDRLKANLSMFQNGFSCSVLEYTPQHNADAFGPFCLKHLEQMA